MQVTSLPRIYYLKVTIVALVPLIIGVGLQILAAHTAAVAPALAFSHARRSVAPCLTAGLFGITWDCFDGKDKEERENERIHAILEESAPAFRDAVLRGFAVENDDLKRVATPELLDQIAGNVLALRLGDRDFAEEVYAMSEIKVSVHRNAGAMLIPVSSKLRCSPSWRRGGLSKLFSH